MSEQTQHVLREALSLLPTERAELIEQLFRSFDFPSRELTDSLWAAQCEERIDAYERGEIKAVSAKQIFDRIDNGQSR